MIQSTTPELHHHTVKGKNLILTIILNVGITLAELIGGIFSGSMALISDATHNFSDVLSLIISYIANKLTGRKATNNQTYGFRRSEIVAAFINSATLIILAIFILIEGSKRLLHPVTVSADWVIWLALASIIVNGLSVLFIHKDTHDNMNIKSAYLHLFSDLLTSIAVLTGGLAMKYLGWFRLDSIFSILIAVYLLYTSWGICKSALRIIMQFTPEHLDIQEVVKEIEQIKEIKNIHHVHAWQINEHDIMFEAHADLLKDISVSEFAPVLLKIKQALSQHNINHVTIQPEYAVDDKKEIIY